MCPWPLLRCFCVLFSLSISYYLGFSHYKLAKIYIFFITVERAWFFYIEHPNKIRLLPRFGSHYLMWMNCKKKLNSPSWKRTNSKWKGLFLFETENLLSETFAPNDIQLCPGIQIAIYYFKHGGSSWRLLGNLGTSRLEVGFLMYYLPKIIQATHLFLLIHKGECGTRLLLLSTNVWITTLQSVWRGVQISVYQHLCV